MTTAVLIFVNVFQIYLIIGVGTAFLLQKSGLKAIDSGVEGAGFWFRLITFPGCVALWPVLLYKWIKKLRK